MSLMDDFMKEYYEKTLEGRLVKRIKELEAENARLREALKFYADEKNYLPENKSTHPSLSLWVRAVELDKGERAREALGEKE